MLYIIIRVCSIKKFEIDPYAVIIHFVGLSTFILSKLEKTTNKHSFTKHCGLSTTKHIYYWVVVNNILTVHGC